MPYKNELLLDVFKRKNVERPPVWIMRQAGRILPGYRRIRASVDGFKTLVKNPALVAEVTTEPLDALGVDAAILFSDILVIPECMGLDYDIVEAKGPVFSRRIDHPGDVAMLLSGNHAAAKLQYVYESIHLTKERIAERTPLIGFSGAPWTLFAYMVEGSGSKTFSRAKKFLYQFPDESHELMRRITATVIAYLRQKINCGVDVIQLFDSWSDQLSPAQYLEFSIPYLHEICNAIDQVPIILFPKGAWSSLSSLQGMSFDALSIDWKTPPSFARLALSEKLILQGNMDPCQLYGSNEEIAARTTEMINLFGANHIVNLGHGVYPDTEAAKVRHLVDTVKAYKYR